MYTVCQYKKCMLEDEQGDPYNNFSCKIMVDIYFAYKCLSGYVWLC